MKNGNLKNTPELPVSPCIRVCKIDAQNGLCTGCLRTLDEIAAWSRLDDAAKTRIYSDLELRKQRRNFSKGA